MKLGYEKLAPGTENGTDDDSSIELDPNLKEDIDITIDPERQAPAPKSGLLSILRNPFIWLNALTALHSVGSDNMLPLLLQYPAAPATIPPSLFHMAHGFGTTPRFTGLLYSIACLSAMAVSSFIYPALAKTKSHTQILGLMLAAYPAIYFGFPFTLLPTSQTLSLGLLTLLFLFKGGIFVCALQASMILLTNSVQKESVALAHGVNFMMGGLGRGLGSALVGALFEWGFRVGSIVVPFWSLAVGSVSVVVGGWLGMR